MTIRGTWGTLLLPLAEDDAIDVARLAASLDVIVASGLDGVYTNGTRLRWPYQGIPAAEADRLRRMVRTLIPEVLSC